MKTTGALLWGPGTGSGWSVEDIEVDPPNPGEVLVKLAAAGLCHSDYHFDAGDCVASHLPLLGGHEGAGVVSELGAGVETLAVGDRVITTFMPSCGRCRWCTAGRGNLCDRGAGLMEGRALDGTFRVHARGEDVGPMTYLGTFSPYIVCPVDSLVRIDDDIPWPAAAITGCAVPTGWGTAVNIAGVRIGDVVVVIGTGGVGMNAIQGARMAGARTIVAVDPVDFKRKKAHEFGATHDAPSVAEAFELVSDLTRGAMADRVIITMGVVDGRIIDPALGLTSKGGVLAIGGVSSMSQHEAAFSIFPFVMSEKQIRGGLYGGCVTRTAIPMLLDLYRKGTLMLDELVTRTYRLDQINEAYRDMEEGRNIRGVIVYD
jgi:S-(hydroxymethyl)glutathione dehydrogenase/alcohol dehydrogenase